MVPRFVDESSAEGAMWIAALSTAFCVLRDVAWAEFALQDGEVFDALEPVIPAKFANTGELFTFPGVPLRLQSKTLPIRRCTLGSLSRRTGKDPNGM